MLFVIVVHVFKFGERFFSTSKLEQRFRPPEVSGLPKVAAVSDEAKPQIFLCLLEVSAPQCPMRSFEIRIRLPRKLLYRRGPKPDRRFQAAALDQEVGHFGGNGINRWIPFPQRLQYLQVAIQVLIDEYATNIRRITSIMLPQPTPVHAFCGVPSVIGPCRHAASVASGSTLRLIPAWRNRYLEVVALVVSLFLNIRNHVVLVLKQVRGDFGRIN